jgi:hypothetical protein
LLENAMAIVGQEVRVTAVLEAAFLPILGEGYTLDRQAVFIPVLAVACIAGQEVVCIQDREAAYILDREAAYTVAQVGGFILGRHRMILMLIEVHGVPALPGPRTTIG